VTRIIVLASAILVLVVGWTFSQAQVHTGDPRPHSRLDHAHWTAGRGDGGNVDSQPSCGTALPKFDEWYCSKPLFTFQQAATLYARFSHCAQPKIQHPWTRQPNGTALANIQSGGKFYSVRIPKEFLRKSIALIERILEQGHARYLFALDLDHGHLYVPRVNFEAVYDPLWDQSGIGPFLEAVLADKRLRVLFHTQELISPRTPPRVLIGTYDNDPTLLAIDGNPPRSLLSVLGEDYGAYSFQFMAHPLGVFELKDGTRVDFSFHDWLKLWPTDYLRQLGVELINGDSPWEPRSSVVGDKSFCITPADAPSRDNNLNAGPAN
jgi:hypothetical protein